MDFTNAMIGGIPLIVLIAGLTAFAKTLGLAGKGLTIFSAGTGLVFGILYQISIKPPAVLAEWLATIVYGLGLGMVTSGLYDLARRDLFNYD